MEFPSNPKRIIAIIEKSNAAIIEKEGGGSEVMGDMWLETCSFSVDTPLIKVLTWAFYKKCSGRLIISIDENTEVTIEKKDNVKEEVPAGTKPETPVSEPSKPEVVSDKKETPAAGEVKQPVIPPDTTVSSVPIPDYNEVMKMANKSEENIAKLINGIPPNS